MLEQQLSESLNHSHNKTVEYDTDIISAITKLVSDDEEYIHIVKTHDISYTDSTLSTFNVNIDMLFMENINLVIPFNSLCDEMNITDFYTLLNYNCEFIMGGTRVTEMPISIILVYNYLCDRTIIMKDDELEIVLFDFKNISKYGLPRATFQANNVKISHKKKLDFKIRSYHINKGNITDDVYTRWRNYSDKDVLFINSPKPDFIKYLSFSNSFPLNINHIVQILVVYFQPNDNYDDNTDIPILTSFQISANGKNYVEYDIIPINFFSFTMYIISFVPELNTLEKLKENFKNNKVANGGINFSRIDKISCKIDYETKCDNNLNNYDFCYVPLRFNILLFRNGITGLRYTD